MQMRPDATLGWGFHNRKYGWVFPGGLVVRIWCFHCRGPGLIPDRELRSCKPQDTAKKKKKAKKIWVEVGLDEQLGNI